MAQFFGLAHRASIGIQHSLAATVPPPAQKTTNTSSQTASASADRQGFSYTTTISRSPQYGIVEHISETAHKVTDAVISGGIQRVAAVSEGVHYTVDGIQRTVTGIIMPNAPALNPNNVMLYSSSKVDLSSTSTPSAKPGSATFRSASILADKQVKQANSSTLTAYQITQSSKSDMTQPVNNLNTNDTRADSGVGTQQTASPSTLPPISSSMTANINQPDYGMPEQVTSTGTFQPAPESVHNTRSDIQTATGTFNRISANRITAVFVIDGIQRTFNATVSPSIQPFTSKDATLSYGNEDELTSTRSYSGRIGPNKFQIFLDNGVMMDGKLQGYQNQVFTACTVTGSGAWEQN